MPGPGPQLSLILGGARSGKSTYAEALVMRSPPPWRYVATAEPLDDEMARRIDEHRRRRGPGWTTIEAPYELAVAIEAHAADGDPILVDCLTLWLSNMLLAGRAIEAEADALLAALSGAAGKPGAGRIVMVSNEVGLGIVPDNALARRFRDAQGRLNQQVAARADYVVLMAAGLPLVLKSPQPAGGGPA